MGCIPSKSSGNGVTVLDCLFFPEHGQQNLASIVKYLDAARTSIDACVFTITENQIAKALIRAKKRGVAVRVVTDNDKVNDIGSDIHQLQQAGIPVRVDNSPAHMHHKFCIIDNRILLNGSFNWTHAASTQNRENVVVCDAGGMISPFNKEFQKLWKEFAHNKLAAEEHHNRL